MRAIGEHCGVGLQSIYNEFGDKEQLYAAVLDHYSRKQVDENLAALLATEPAIDGLRAVLRFWGQYHADPETRGCLFVMTLTDFGREETPLVDVARRHVRTLELLFQDALKRAQSEGDLPPGREPRELARALVALGNGVAVLGRANVSKAFLRDVLKVGEGLLA